MALSVVNNIAALQGQHNLSRTSTNLAKSLERLSSGLKINRGADAPAGLVISEQQRAQISGLTTAIDNTSKAVSMVQTAEGALTEINSLLVKMRGLALDSANTAVMDSNTYAANQAEITNALASIQRIANNTQFGSRKLLNGESAINATISGSNNELLGSLRAGTSMAAANYTVDVTAGSGGNVTGPVGAGSMAAAGSITVSGGGLSGLVSVALAVGDTVASGATKIQAALDNAGAQGGGTGKFVVDVVGGNQIRIRSNILGSAAVTGASDAAGTATVMGFVTGAGTTGAAGTALAVTVGGAASSVSAGTQGLNNQVTFNGSEGLSFAVTVANGSVTTAGTTLVNVADNGLVFQIGANSNQTVKVSVDKSTTDSLGSGLSGLATSATNLSQIDVTSANGAQDAIKIIDKAINDVSTLRGKLGAVQSQSLESTANNLRATLENTVSAESVIRDTDFAAETSNFIKQQIMMQAGTSVLSNANMVAQQVLGLLKS